MKNPRMPRPGVGHNSVQYRRERDFQSERERERLVTTGIVTPVNLSPPTMLYRSSVLKGGWSTIQEATP